MSPPGRGWRIAMAAAFTLTVACAVVLVLIVASMPQGTCTDRANGTTACDFAQAATPGPNLYAALAWGGAGLVLLEVGLFSRRQAAKAAREASPADPESP